MPQCQFMFSAVFGFRKVTQEIFSELDETKAEVPIFTVPKRRTEDETKTGSRAATPALGAAYPGPTPRHGVGPCGTTDLALSPIYSTKRKIPSTESHIPQNIPTPPPSSNPSRGVLELFLALCRRGELSPEAIFITMPASGVMCE